MKQKNFLDILFDVEETPTELLLSVELRCREIMASKESDNIKRYCTHLVRHQAKQDVFLASVLGRLVELEAQLAVKEVREQKSFINKIKKVFKKKS
tara:strand:+ start:175 stop:462 length:288 start_codon:yes stop_codon:yes gene_type:complete